MPDSNGHSFAVGAILGNLQQGQERLIFVAEMHGRSIAELTAVQAAMAASLARIEAKPPAPACPHPRPPSKDPMNWKDWLQLAVFVAAMAAVLMGKMPLTQALSIVGKPLGF